MFIAQTRLRQTASRDAQGAVTLFDPPVDRARFNGVVRSVEEAMSYVPPAQRPPADQWGGYDLYHDLRCSILLNPIGVRADASRHLIVLYDAWNTNASRQAGDPPVLRNSHEFGLRRGMTKAQLQAQIVAEVEAYLTRASLAGVTGDQRDPRHIALASDEADEEFDKIRDLRDVVRNLNTAASNPSSAPLVSMVPK